MKLIQNSLRASVLVMATLLLSITNLSAQNPTIRCHTVHMDSVRHAENPSLQTNEEFEDWIQKEITLKEHEAQSSLIINGVYQIPVIVHIIHNGEAVGTGTNLSAAVIQSQIDVLNEDFRRLLGTNGYNTHPDGADTQIEFCLAKRRPDGTAFPAGDDGINRLNRNTPGWGAPPYTTAFIDATIKPYNIATQGYDAAVYMNLWSVDISGGILGYAQFPTTVLGGMGCGAQSVNTDGVVMDYATLGKAAVTGFPGPYNEGRTATHEIGHWLGLRHIWGDGGCGVDDYCADTPLSDAANFGCPNTNSCTDPGADPNDMVENYMDYSDDLCMNIFTDDQKMRMRTVLENSPIRATLITSDACIPPALNDASIVNVTSPLGDNCPGSITPNVTLRNRGSLNLTSATIEYTIDGGTPTSFAWTGTITPGNEANVSLPAFSSNLGIHTFRAYSLLPNTVTDPDPTFDTTTIQFAVSNGYQPNHLEDFEGGSFPPDVKWTVVNPNSDCIAWVGQACVSSTGNTNNSAALMTNFGNGTNQDEYIYTPIFILPCNATSADFVFDKAYKKRVNGSGDRLRVQISEDCGATWGTVLYDQSGNGLVSSAGNSNSFWIPGAAADWDNVVLDLMPYVTGVSKNVQFRFRATNDGNGGNLYVDNVEFNAVTPGEIEVSATGVNVLDEGYYDFGAQPIGGPTTVVFTIDNPGTSALTLTGPITIVGDPEFVLNTTFGTTTVPAGGSTTFSVDFTPTGSGPYSAILSFGTNDCDEGTYNFELTGTGNVSPPTAAFTAAPTTICSGSTVTYTDGSTGATGWTWSFPNGTPNSATGPGPHVITYNTPGGPYDAQLDVINGYGTDTDLQAGLITVINGTGIVLPISEGFVGATFAPVGWSINNGGIADTWVRDAANGNAPTAGNSAVMDNFTNNTSGNEDDLVMPGADFTGLVSAQLQFDVAYARYSATYNDQLQVLVSDDCGQTYTVVYDKASTVLATDPDQTAAYTPATWRQETVDLSAYVGSGKVDVIFKNIGGWGQFLYLDNINLTGVVSACDDPDIPTITYAPATICDGDDATLTIAGNLDDATDWYVYTGTCGGTVVGNTNTTTIVVTPAAPSTTYYVRGEGGCVVPGSCGSVSVTVDPIEDATFSYGSAAYCVDASDPTPTITGVGSGTFTSAPAGLSINASTGAIDVSTSTPNTYTVTYTTPGTCSGNSNVVVTINALPAPPTILTSGATTFCAGGSVDLTSSQATNNVWTTAETTQTINVTGTGSYSVTYTDGNGCSSTSLPTAVTVNALPAVPTISPDGPTTFCTGGSVNLTSSQASGNVWSTTETTQTINAAVTGNYSVTYTDGNGCSSTSAITAVTLNANPAAPTISAGGPTTFCAGGSVNLTSSQASGNVWSTTETTQTINVNSTGSYSVTYTDGNGCSATSALTAVTVNANPSAPTITASGPTTFCAGGSVTLTSSQGSGNVWSTSSTSNNIIVTTGGPYSVTYTDGNGCSATSAVTNVTVNPAPVIAIGTVNDPSTCATLTGSIQITGSGTGVVSWTGTASGNSGSVTLPYTISGLAAGSYNVTFDDGCGSNMLNQVLTDPTPPAPPVITAGGATTFCDGGSVTLTSSYGSGNTWSTAETTSSINVVGSGTYSVTYTDGAGCSSSSAPVVVTVNALPAVPTISPDGPTTFCSGGSVNLSSSQASGNVWSTAETTQIINVSTAGPYSVTYTDGNGCSSTSAVTNITVNATPATPTINAGGPTTFCAGGSVNLTSSQASGNVWSTTETTQVINVTGTGAYSVTYTAGNGCSATSAVTNVTVNPIPVISIGGVTNPSACATNTGSVQVSGSGTGIVTWTGTASGNSGSVTLPYTIPNLGAGPYSITVDQNGCTSNTLAPTLVDPAAPSAPNVVASGPTTFCAGGSVNLTSSYASGNDWSTAETTQSITVSSTGSYTVTYTDGSGCSSTSAPIAVTVNANPTTPVVTASGALTFCDGGSVDLTSDITSGIVWSSTETTQTINVSASGTFDVTYTDGNGCTATSLPTVVTVNAIPATPIITASGPTTFCDGGSVDLTSDQASGNLWSTTETTQTIAVSTDGSYSVTYTDGNGCSATSTPITVVVNPLPTVALGAFANVCDHVVAFSLAGGTPAGGTYSGTGVSGGDFDPAIAGIGTHTITYDYTDGNGCSNSTSQDITVDDCTDIKEITDGDIAVYPNPASNLVFVSVQGTLIDNIKVYDGAGRLIAEYTENAEKVAVDLSQFARGVYNLEIVLGNNVHRSKVVKQ